jgi:hypothetical protein
VTDHWKGLEESYNFVVGKTSTIIHMQKLWPNKIFTFILWWTSLLPMQLKPLLPRAHGCSLGQLKHFLEDMIVSWRKINFPRE